MNLDPRIADQLEAQLRDFNELSIDDIQRRMQWSDQDSRDFLRLFKRVRRESDGCWLWTGSLTPKGYSQAWFRGRMRRAYRVFFLLLVGPVPDGTELDHLCRRRACVNPAHLEAVTHRENVLRGSTLAAANAAKTECPYGHGYTPENTYYSPKGHRVCRICRTEESRRRRRART